MPRMHEAGLCPIQGQLLRALASLMRDPGDDISHRGVASCFVLYSGDVRLEHQLRENNIETQTLIAESKTRLRTEGSMSSVAFPPFVANMTSK
eukprot:5707877-Amphidinium_carterae.1